MTFGGICFSVVISILIGFGAVALHYETRTNAFVCVLIAIIAIAIVWGGTFWYFNNTAAGARAMKDQQSNFNNGIERRIVVMDYSGNIVAEYEGKMDIETSNEKYVLFDDENGKRHIIYNTTGFIIIDEK